MVVIPNEVGWNRLGAGEGSPRSDFVDDIGAAIAREKELKGWRRCKKISLIQKVNPYCSDLSGDLIE